VLSDPIQGNDLGNVKPLPSCFKCQIDIAPAASLASGGTSSLPMKKILAFVKTSCQKGISGIGALVP